MNNKYIISAGTDKMKSVYNNTFSQIGGQAKAFTFTTRKSGHFTSTDSEYISLEKRRKYQYYEKK